MPISSPLACGPLNLSLGREGRPSHHVGHTAGQVNPPTRRQRDHRSSSALRTRRKARPSTAASKRTKTPFGSTISISPSGRDNEGGKDAPTVGDTGSLPSGDCSVVASSTRVNLG